MNELENGYIKLYRSFLNWEWHDNEYMLTVFIHCLMLANWKDKRWHGQVIERGSFITSYEKLAKACGITRNTCMKCCKTLQETGELTIKSTRQYTLITVNNYAKYQEENGSVAQGVAQGVAQEVAQGVAHPVSNTVSNTVRTTEESKKVKNKEIIDIVLFLNKRTGKNYRPESNKTVRLINARFNEGFKKEDFYTVIDKKCNEWSGTKMEQYLRPETLFGTKFESYLNQRQTFSLPFGELTPDWYTSEPVRITEPIPATEEEIEALRKQLQKGK